MTKAYLSLFLIVLLLSAGCAQYPASSRHEVDFRGTIERTEDGFRMNGTVRIMRGTTIDYNFSSVSITLYNAEKTAYRSIALGRLSTRPNWGPVRKKVNFSVTKLPTYILIESPGFWGGTDVATIGFVWDKKENHYTSYIVREKSEKFQE